MCVCVGGGSHAESSFLLPVRTLSGIQPELINSNRTPDYPGCNGTQAGGLAGGKRVGGGEQPQAHAFLHHKYHLDTHTKAPTVCNTEAIINTCNNIFTARNSPLQIRTAAQLCAHTHTRKHTCTLSDTRVTYHAHKKVFIYTCSEFCVRKQVETEQVKSRGLQNARKRRPHLATLHR